MKHVNVWPITLYCMVKFENYMAQMIIMTRQCVARKNHVARLKVKDTVCTVNPDETFLCLAHNFVMHGGI